MRIGISAIAWDVPEDAAVAVLLGAHGIDAIDVAPGKYFPEPGAASDRDITAARERWAAWGIEITGMQSLLFGTQGLNVFGDADSRARLRTRLRDVMRVGALLGAPRLVFGSPRNRDRGTLDDATAHARAVEFFAGVADDARAAGVLLCLEPNPARYGCNFMLDAASTAAVVRAIAAPSVRMQFDVGALAISGESPLDVLQRHGDLVGHVHASEPDLVTLGDGGVDHRAAGEALRRVLPGHVVTIEMVASPHEPHLDAIARALAVARSAYGSEAST